MRILKCFVLLSVCFCFVSCMTPIQDRSTLNELTTCKTGSLDKIKKNLVLMGYEIAEADSQMIVTNFKQENGYGGSKSFSQVNAVKLDDNTIKFKVRERRVYKTQEEDQSYVASAGTNRKTSYGYESQNSGQAKVVSYKNVTESDDSDRVYYEEKIDFYRTFRDEVCGFGK